MVEIITKGELPGEKVYEATCFSCKTRFRFKQKEGRVRSDQRDGDYISIQCPLEGCHQQVTVTLRSASRSYSQWDR